MRSFPAGFDSHALVLLVYWCGMHAAPAFAGLAPSRTSGTTAIASARDADMIAVQRMLEHKVVVQKLRDYGSRPSRRSCAPRACPTRICTSSLPRARDSRAAVTGPAPSSRS